MFAEVEPLYREGIRVKHQGDPLRGQIISGDVRGVRVLNLWPLSWLANVYDHPPPLGRIWHPVFCGLDYDSIVMRGFEESRAGKQRRWTTQKWICRIVSPEMAREAANPRPRHFELPAVMPPSPPPANPDDPFNW